MLFKLIAVPEDRLSLTAEGKAVIIGPPGPFEVVDKRNLAMLQASVEEAVVSRSALAVIAQYGTHLLAASRMGPEPDHELVAAIDTIREVLER